MVGDRGTEKSTVSGDPLPNSSLLSTSTNLFSEKQISLTLNIGCGFERSPNLLGKM